ncbi:MAG: cardiolipin synthase [Pseudobutyrivibrio sp.]|nr:cardiolipin synthase [Pseudobutyrivibrio sp.]
MNNKKSYRKVGNSIARIAAVGILVLLQVAWIGFLLFQLGSYSQEIQLVTSLFTLLLVLIVYGSYTNSANKIPWIIFIAFVPVFGILLYATMGYPDVTKKARLRYEDIDARVFPLLKQDMAVMDSLKKENRLVGSHCTYVSKEMRFPVYKNTDLKYFDDPVPAIASMVEDLKSAKDFIFMEYYAIQDDKTFEPIKEVLVDKAQSGVRVRLIYDDIGSASFINEKFADEMKSLGVDCRIFNHIGPIFKIIMNNRDHRKITVIDNKVGYTGGYNLANIYTHISEPYGRWKDTGVRIEGKSVSSLTAMFLEVWNAVSDKDKDDKDLTQFFPEYKEEKDGDGYIQPYADVPYDTEQVGETVYMSMLQTAVDYCWFSTPYLVISDELSRECEMAAKRGVDVRVITPGIPDKKLVNMMTKSYYNTLARNGVRIFEFTPGFCHAKMSICDGKAATVGTFNLDFRSLYLHFEDGVYMYGCSAVGDIENDFKALLEDCTEVTEKYASKNRLPLRLWQCAMRLMAPLV